VCALPIAADDSKPRKPGAEAKLKARQAKGSELQVKSIENLATRPIAKTELDSALSLSEVWVIKNHVDRPAAARLRAEAAEREAPHWLRPLPKQQTTRAEAKGTKTPKKAGRTRKPKRAGRERERERGSESDTENEHASESETESETERETEREQNRARDREKDKDKLHDRNRREPRDRSRSRSPKREASRERDTDRQKDKDRDRDRERRLDAEGDRSVSISREDRGRDRDRDRDRSGSRHEEREPATSIHASSSHVNAPPIVIIAIPGESASALTALPAALESLRHWPRVL